MTSPDYDLLVIGGGPAGCAAAAFARQQGWKVCLVEKESFPRFRIGESLLPTANGILQAMGAWPKITAAGFVKKYGAIFCLADGMGEKEVNFANSHVPGLEETYQVERAKFDALLLDHARELGTEIRIGAKVSAVEESADQVVATITSPDGRAEQLRARWLIDAGGRDNSYPNLQKQLLDPATLPRRTAIYSHFSGLARPAGRRAGHTIVARLEEGWFWIIPLENDKTSVGLVLRSEHVRGRSPEQTFRDAVASSTKLRQLIGNAEPCMPFRVTADYSYFRKRLAHGRIVLAGDAGGFIDPIFSSGVYLALWSAQEAVAMLAKSGDRALSGFASRRYTRAIKKHAAVFRRLVDAFYDNASFAVFLCPRPPFDLTPGITSIVAGHARLTWPLWWRFQVFLLSCWLQRFFPLVPRADYHRHGRRVGSTG